MNFIIAFLSGILSAFTPCAIILIPLISYRFFNKKNKKIKQYVLFILGFILSYIILGYFLLELLTSRIQNGFKLGLGILFIILGILSLMKKLNPMNLPLSKCSFTSGIIFAILIAANPCSIPYLSLIISSNLKSTILINIFSFALGIILPAILFSIIGHSILNFTKKTGKIQHTIEKLMSLILIVSGIYIAWTIKNFTNQDIWPVVLILVFSVAILARAFFLINSKKDLFSIRTILLMFAISLIIFIAVNHCNDSITSKESLSYFGEISQENKIESCTAYSECKICKECFYTFSIATLLVVISILLGYFMKIKKINYF